MAMPQVLQACAWLLPGCRNGKTFQAFACRGSLDEMQGIIGAPKRPVVGEKAQDLLGEQALAFQFFSQTLCEMRWLEQLPAKAGVLCLSSRNMGRSRASRRRVIGSQSVPESFASWASLRLGQLARKTGSDCSRVWCLFLN